MSRIRQLLTFLGIFALILFASSFYMFERLSFYLQLAENPRLLAAILLGGPCLLTLVALPIGRKLPPSAATALAWAVYPWMGIALLMLVTVLAADLVWLLLRSVPVNLLPEQSALLQHHLGIMALGVTGLLGGFSLWNGLRPVPVKPLAVTLSRLHPSLDGLRIVQITDLHIGPFIGRNWLRRVVDKVNALKPDLIVITGDLVDGSVDEQRRHVAPLADLRALHGTYFITGNHEYYSGVEEWCDHVASLGVRVLRNERVSIATGSADEGFDLAGVDDSAGDHLPGGGHDLSKALAGRDPNRVLVLLAHRPSVVQEAAAHGVDLQLSGHTHGGQIWPFTYLVHLQQLYSHGL